MQNNVLNSPDNLGKATKRQIGKHIGLLDRIPSIANLAREVTAGKAHTKGTTAMTRISNIVGLGDAHILTLVLSIFLVIIVGWILRGSIGASTSGSPTYILFIQQCFTIWLWLLIILIVLNFLLNMIFL